MCVVYKCLNSENESYKNYYNKIIEIALNINLDIDSNLRYKLELKKVCCQVNSIRTQIFRIDNLSIKELIKKWNNEYDK